MSFAALGLELPNGGKRVLDPALVVEDGRLTGALLAEGDNFPDAGRHS